LAYICRLTSFVEVLVVLDEERRGLVSTSDVYHDVMYYRHAFVVSCFDILTLRFVLHYLHVRLGWLVWGAWSEVFFWFLFLLRMRVSIRKRYLRTMQRYENDVEKMAWVVKITEKIADTYSGAFELCICGITGM
jgi:hypothetical protein